jgi:hypothetical protein
MTSKMKELGETNTQACFGPSVTKKMSWKHGNLIQRILGKKQKKTCFSKFVIVKREKVLHSVIRKVLGLQHKHSSQF